MKAAYAFILNSYIINNHHINVIVLEVETYLFNTLWICMHESMV